MRRRLRDTSQRPRKRRALATDEDPQEESSTRSVPAPPTRILPPDNSHNDIFPPAVTNNVTEQPSQQISPSVSQDRQLVVRPAADNNVTSTYVTPRRRPAKRSDFNIAIICALEIEANAVIGLFDRHWDEDGPPYDKAEGDINSYSTGAIGRHDIVVVHMGGIGKVFAASAAAYCKQSFPSIRLGLVVGICGAIPFGPEKEEIVLGDVLISNGVVQYDFGRQLPDGFARKEGLLDSLGRPNPEMRSLFAKLKTLKVQKDVQRRISDYMNILRAIPELAATYPGTANDRLFAATYDHLNSKVSCEVCGCNGSEVPRFRLQQQDSPQPVVHFGLLGSADSVMKSAKHRDDIAQASRPALIGFEMEGAGVWDNFPCVVIKGACDYADSHKTKVWQKYAAATAAACMKAVLCYWIPSSSSQDNNTGPSFSVPYPQNSSFVGRSEILQKLYQLPLNSTSQTRVALCGLGGIGKTQIAIQYTYWIRDNYPTLPVFWIHASNNERFREAYRRIAQEFKMPGHDNPKEDVLALVKRCLESDTCGHWLMVIDNADDLELFFSQNGGLGRYIPECAHGTILATTRNLQVASRVAQGMATSTIMIGEMNEDETVQLLSTRLDETDTMFSTLSARLEHLPLALVQAASFIQERRITISYYIQLLDKSDQDLVNLLSQDFETVGRDSDTPRAVAEAWVVSFEQIRQRDTLAGELLSIMSLLDRQAIPHKFLSAYAQDQGHEELQLTKALGVLKAFSFIIEDKDHNFDMHRLVHLVTQKWLDQKRCTQHFAEQALWVVSECFPFGVYENWKICNTCLPHASAVLNLKEKTTSTKGKMARSRLLHNAGVFASEQGQLQKAEKYQEEALDLRQDLLGEEHPDTLNSTYELASTYIGQGRWNEAELLNAKVLEIRKRVLGTEHISTLASMNNLALTYKVRGRWKEAELLYTQALEIYKRVLGADHPHTLTSMHNLAAILRKMNQLDDALRLMQDCLRLRQKVHGPDHPHTIATRGELASIYWEQGQFSEAEMIQVEVLEKSRRIMGVEHPDTLSDMHNLAYTWRDMGRLDEAIELMQDCLLLRQKVLGPDHPDTITTHGQLASIYWKQGQFSEAEMIQVEVLEKRRRILGKEHPGTLLNMHNLAITWKDMGRLDEAIELMQDCLRLKQKVLGPDHSETLTTHGQLASIYWEQSQFSETEKIEVEILEKRRRILGEEHPGTLLSMHNLASTWKDMGRLDEAIELMQDCLHLSQKVLGPDHPETIDSASMLKDWLDEKNESDVNNNADDTSEVETATTRDQEIIGGDSNLEDKDNSQDDDKDDEDNVDIDSDCESGHSSEFYEEKNTSSDGKETSDRGNGNKDGDEQLIRPQPGRVFQHDDQ